MDFEFSYFCRLLLLPSLAAAAAAGCCCCVYVPGLLLFGVQKDGWWGMDPLEQMMLYYCHRYIHLYRFSDARLRERAGRIYTAPMEFCLNREFHMDIGFCVFACVLCSCCQRMCSTPCWIVIQRFSMGGGGANWSGGGGPQNKRARMLGNGTLLRLLVFGTKSTAFEAGKK